VQRVVGADGSLPKATRSDVVAPRRRPNARRPASTSKRSPTTRVCTSCAHRRTASTALGQLATSASRRRLATRARAWRRPGAGRRWLALRKGALRLHGAAFRASHSECSSRRSPDRSGVPISRTVLRSPEERCARSASPARSARWARKGRRRPQEVGPVTWWKRIDRPQRARQLLSVSERQAQPPPP